MTYDVAVIGGGPAGSSAGTMLARAGMKAVILERERFPRFHIGESLLPVNQDLFQKLGLDKALRGQAFTLKFGAQFVSNCGTVERAFDFWQGGLGKDTFAYQVEREVFDDLLLRHAQQQGCEVREGTSVLDVETSIDRPCRLKVRTDGVESTIEARWIVDASGQSSLIAKLKGLREKHATHQKMAVFSRYRGAKLREGRKAGNIDIVLGNGGWFWLIPLRKAQLSVGFVSDVAKWKASGLEAEDYLKAAIARSPYVKGRCDGAERIEPVHTAANYAYTARKFVGDGFLLAGDAAEFLDPIFSTGVLIAMRSGAMAGEQLAERLKSGKPVTASMFSGYEREFRKWTRNLFRMIDAYYSPGFAEVFLTPKKSLGIPGAVIRLLAGHSSPGWLTRLRLWAFYKIIRLNNKHHFIPDPRPAESAIPHG